MAESILRELSVAELDAALADTEEQLRMARREGAPAADSAVLEVARRRLLDEFRRRGL
ncbi:hypothetical protein [Rhodococcus sp. 14-2470-1b]|uniref:hypothetical protein n=1 Tax=Rhodococcus sp. 14-2470-1b TaxID=2023149 RepID=UPI0015961C0C|nr:hypothetical protein [Rhodococcus sp. 14-2470-1b]